VSAGPPRSGSRSRRSRGKGIVYLDSSALVKLVVAEAETNPLITYLRTRPTQVTSRIATVEVGRAAGRQEGVAPGRALAVLDQVTLIELDEEVADRASGLAPATMRSLDAIHLATAIGLRRELEALITYDARLAAAAAVHGLPVVAPGSKPS